MLMRFVRSATMQAVGQDYVRTAAAKGLTRNAALIRHGLPNVGLSVITVLGLQVAGIIVGAVVIEQLFSLPGHRADAGRRRQRARPAQGAGRAARAHRLRAGDRLRRRPGAPGDRSPAAGGDMTERRARRRTRGAEGRAAVALDMAAAPVGPVHRSVRAHRRRGRRATALVIARFWTPFDPRQVEISNRWALPGLPHLLGTDGSGRDILSLLMAGSRTTVMVAVGAGVIATVIGVALAALGALTARWMRESVAVLRRHPDRLPGADHRHDDQRGLGRLARGGDLVGRHRLRRQHRPRHPTRAAPRAAQRLRARGTRVGALAAAEPLASPAAERRAGVHRAAVVGHGRGGARRGGPVVPRLRRSRDGALVGSAAGRAAAVHHACIRCRCCGRVWRSRSPCWG